MTSQQEEVTDVAIERAVNDDLYKRIVEAEKMVDRLLFYCKGRNRVETVYLTDDLLDIRLTLMGKGAGSTI